MKNLSLCSKHGIMDKCEHRAGLKAFLGMIGFVLIFSIAIGLIF